MSLSIQRDALGSKYGCAWLSPGASGLISGATTLLGTAVGTALILTIMERIVVETQGTGGESHQL